MRLGREINQSINLFICQKTQHHDELPEERRLGLGYSFKLATDPVY